MRPPPDAAPTRITQRDLRSRCGEIMDSVQRGRAFIVTRNGVLIPLRRRRTVTREQFAALSANAPLIDFARFRTDFDAVSNPEPRDPYAR